MMIEAIKQGIMRDEQEKPARNYIYMTKFAACPRAYVLAEVDVAFQKPFTAESMLTFADGNAQEDVLIRALEHSNLVRVLETQAAIKFQTEKLTLSGKADAIVTTPDSDEPIVLEIKSASPNVFDAVRQYGAQHVHAWQLNAYMVFGGFSSGVLLYKNRASPQMLEFKTTLSDKIVDDVHWRVGLFEAALEWDGEGLPLPAFKPNELTDTQNVCRWCPAKVRCFSRVV